MIDFTVQGLIFDLDDTLIDNKERTSDGLGLHERSRLMAIRELGRARGMAALANYPPEACNAAFRKAKFQTIESAFWYMLTDAGAVSSETPESPNHELIVALAARKHELYDTLIREEVEALPGAAPARSTTIHAASLRHWPPVSSYAALPRGTLSRSCCPCGPHRTWWPITTPNSPNSSAST